MKRRNNVYKPQDIPLGLSMVMAQNVLAFDTFAKLSTSQKQQLINDSHNTHSSAEMKQLVDNMADDIGICHTPQNNNFV